MSIAKRNATAVCGVMIAASIVFFTEPSQGRPSLAQTIVPGQRIGSLQLKSYSGQLPLGKPDASDAGMSHYHYLWISKSSAHIYTTFAVAVSNSPINGGPGQTIQSIRVTSPFFHTVNGISVGTSLSTAKRRYHRLHPDPDQPGIFIDSGLGIAFEFASARSVPASRCVAISIFKPHDPQVFTADQIRDLMPKRR